MAAAAAADRAAGYEQCYEGGDVTHVSGGL